ncbi:hypothetical protein QM012_006659 [Aureobasidium pullulans]|uniref:Zn(2)-C6 fungal-type domain-containing protein n=1 Tax=Aureobasidium pullulans TaxID=5580 RepID=A0ABR0TPQ6_AURPU
MPSPDEAVSDGYFNDLSQQLPDQTTPAQPPKSKRVACVLCRKRKLRCDGAKPSCATCTRLSHNCAYDEVRKKSGPKRGYVKELEARLAQVETLLNNQAGVEMPLNAIDQPVINGDDLPDMGGIDPDQGRLMQEMRVGQSPPSASNSNPATRQQSLSEAYETRQPAFWEGELKSPSWVPNLSMLATGMDEPLPPPDVCAELTAIYFERVHPSAPILHRPRFLMSMQNTSPALRPRLSLQYAVWTLAASAHPKYENMVDTLYRRARHYLERDEMSGVGEKMINIATVQAWQCIAAYEFKMMYFPRAWLSTGRTARLGLMMGLHRVDGPNIDVKQCLPPPKDWIEKEERRRLFWMTFAGDRYASIGTGWPMTIDETDISTDLPGSDEAFDAGTPEPSMSLKEALTPGGADGLSAMGSVGVIAALFGRNLLHLHRHTSDQNDGDINGVFWKRHRQMDGTILSLLLGLPESLRLPLAVTDPKVVFMNMCIHTSVICLHQAAIFKVEKHQLPAKLATESKMRCLTAAAEISSLMKMSSHLDMAQANPFMAFSLYVAARVFVQYLKSRPRDDTARGSLHFLLSALQAMKKTNPLAESFIAQLDVDLEVAGLEDLRSLRVRAARAAQAQAREAMSCPYADQDGNQPTFGDSGLAQHSNPKNSRGGHNPSGAAFPPEVAEILAQPHQGNFKGIFPVQINVSSDNSTTHTSPQTLGSSEADVMELCNTNGVSPSDSSSSSTGPANHATLIFRQSSNNWQTLQQSQQQSPEMMYVHQPQRQVPQQPPQFPQYQQQQTMQDTPMSTLLPHMSDFSTTEFSATEFLNFTKSGAGGGAATTTTVLELGAVDEAQLFQLSDAEWGQVMGEFGENGEFSVENNLLQ